VGTASFDRALCDDRLTLVTFATQNANKQGDYFDGLASRFQATCSARTTSLASSAIRRR
jgi:carboxyl-terminal processing protease